MMVKVKLAIELELLPCWKAPLCSCKYTIYIHVRKVHRYVYIVYVYVCTYVCTCVYVCSYRPRQDIKPTQIMMFMHKFSHCLLHVCTP